MAREGKLPVTGSAVMTLRVTQAVARQWEGRMPEAHEAFTQLARDFESLNLKSASVFYSLVGCSETGLALGQAQAA